MLEKLINVTPGVELAKRLSELHKVWERTMEVSVWGRGKATRVDNKNCRDVSGIGLAKYPGDCDNCNFFMGAKITGDSCDWGARFPACCALDLEGNSETHDS